MQRDDLTLCSAMMVELWTRKREMGGGHDQANLEIHLEAVIERDWTSTWRRSIDGAPGLNSSVS